MQGTGREGRQRGGPHTATASSPPECLQARRGQMVRKGGERWMNSSSQERKQNHKPIPREGLSASLVMREIEERARGGHDMTVGSLGPPTCTHTGPARTSTTARVLRTTLRCAQAGQHDRVHTSPQMQNKPVNGSYLC